MGTICAYDSPSRSLNDINVNKLGFDEFIVRKYEKLCPVRSVGVDFVRDALLKEGVGENLSFCQAKRALGAVGFQKSALDNPDSSHFVFVSSFV